MVVILVTVLVAVYYYRFRSVQTPSSSSSTVDGIAFKVSNATLLITTCSTNANYPNCPPGNNIGKLVFSVENTGQIGVVNVTAELNNRPWNGSLFSSPTITTSSPLPPGTSANLVSQGAVTSCTYPDNTLTVSGVGENGQTFQVTVVVKTTGSCSAPA